MKLSVRSADTLLLLFCSSVVTEVFDAFSQSQKPFTLQHEDEGIPEVLQDIFQKYVSIPTPTQAPEWKEYKVLTPLDLPKEQAFFILQQGRA